jgi:hypothetical protein
MTTTAQNITDTQIRTLREEAVAHGDYVQVDLCDRALSTDTFDQDGNEIARADLSQDDARAECAEAIADAEAIAGAQIADPVPVDEAGAAHWFAERYDPAAQMTSDEDADEVIEGLLDVMTEEDLREYTETYTAQVTRACRAYLASL